MTPQKKIKTTIVRKLPPHDKVYYKHIARKKLVEYHADLKGMAVSAFYTMLFNEWYERNGK